MKLFLFLGDLASNGGIERVTISLANALSHHYDVTIVSLYNSGKNQAFDINGNVNVIYINDSNEISMYNRKLGLINGVLFDLYYLCKKKRQITKKLRDHIHHNDIIISCDVKMTCLLYGFSKEKQTKLVAIEHFEHDIGNPLLIKLKKVLYRKISAVVSLTPEDNDKYCWMDLQKHWVIPNIVLPPSDTDITNKKKNVALAIGRLTHQKGFDLLLHAWSGANTNGWELRIIGDGEDKEFLTKLAEKLEISNVTFVPFQKKISQQFSESRVFILSSRYEGLGMVLLEALSYGLACISFACPAGPATILSKNNGILVPADDVQQMSRELTSLLQNEDTLTKFEKDASNSITDYLEAGVVKKWEELLSVI
ncbi:glycosyltransferase family 4 protein [Enterobacteriaceae bacterium 4M9]|nr:glycosyltransferase family 4 protein [Enterobacteriaceae bacterium 4M9]